MDAPNPTEPNPWMDPTQPNPTHGWTQPMSISALSRYSSDVPESILTSFITDKVGNQKVFYFPTSPN